MKEKSDSLYWRVEQWSDSLQFEVAASHARKGGTAVILTNRKDHGRVALEHDYGDEASSRMTVLSTKER